MTKLNISLDLSDSQVSGFLEGLLNLARNVENKRLREGGLLPEAKKKKEKKPKPKPKPKKPGYEYSEDRDFEVTPLGPMEHRDFEVRDTPEVVNAQVFNTAATPEPEPLLRIISDAWVARYEARTGSKYAFQGAKDGKAIKALLRDSEGNIAELDIRMNRLFEDPFHLKNADLTYFSSVWNRLGAAPLTGMSSVQAFAEGGEV